jgi:hypothetical protein
VIKKIGVVVHNNNNQQHIYKHKSLSISKVHLTMLYLSVCFALASFASASVDFSLRGYGLQRLKGGKHALREPTTCENVEVFWYKDAVIDNFSPINNQQKWEGEGQRYWVNKQFWGGEGFPM